MSESSQVIIPVWIRNPLLASLKAVVGAVLPAHDVLVLFDMHAVASVLESICRAERERAGDGDPQLLPPSRASSRVGALPYFLLQSGLASQ